MKIKVSVLTGLLLMVPACKFGAKKDSCLEQVTVNLDYVTNNTNQDYQLAIKGQNEILLPKNKTTYLDKDIFTQSNVCKNFSQQLGAIYQAKNQLGTIEFNATKTNGTFTFTAKFNANEDSVADFEIANQTFTGNLALSIDEISADGKLQKATISLENQTQQPDVLD